MAYYSTLVHMFSLKSQWYLCLIYIHDSCTVMWTLFCWICIDSKVNWGNFLCQLILLQVHSYIYSWRSCYSQVFFFLHKCLMTLFSNLQCCIKSLDREHLLSLLETLRQGCILPLLTDCWQNHWTILSFIIIASHRFCIKMKVECTSNPWFGMILLHNYHFINENAILYNMYSLKWNQNI